MIGLPSTPFDYFLSLLRERKPALLGDSESVYVAATLTRMISTNNYYPVSTSGKAVDRPFAIQYLEASSLASELERAITYQQIGDCLLFFSSVFRLKIEEGSVPLEYYLSLGANCYRHSGTIKVKNAELMLSLSADFEKASNVIASIFAPVKN